MPQEVWESDDPWGLLELFNNMTDSFDIDRELLKLYKDHHSEDEDK